MSSDGFLVCEEHGDIYWTPGAGDGTAISAATVERVHPDAPAVIIDGVSEIVCFCGRYLRAEVRPAVRVL